MIISQKTKDFLEKYTDLSQEQIDNAIKLEKFTFR